MLRRLFLTAAIFSALFALMPGTAFAADCWKDLVDDYWTDNRVDRTYPISCYREAMESLPPDVQQYSDMEDDLRRALLAAIRDERDSGGGFSGPEEKREPPPVPEDEVAEKKGFFYEVIEKLGPRNADSIPVPLLVLGSIALLLVGAAGVSYLNRYLQARRLPVTAPPTDAGP